MKVSHDQFQLICAIVQLICATFQLVLVIRLVKSQQIEINWLTKGKLSD